ncbi:MAG: MFS transporter [Actinomycetes bacterium]|nr:MAG: MFS transporter [Actinomycetota bacterium]
MKRRGFGRNYWKLWSASAVSNLGDGVATIAYPWLASLITRDGLKLGLVVLAGRLPWLVFSLPAGVLSDRFDRKRLIVGMDLFRAVLTLGVVAVVAANTGVLEAAAGGVTPPNEALLLAVMIAASFLFGLAEVVRDNTAQTLMPSVVGPERLESANGRLWAVELVMNQSVGPPLGGLLIGLALVLPFVVHSATFTVSAVILATLVGTFGRPARAVDAPPRSFRKELAEGFRFLWSHPILKPLAITLGTVNCLATLAQTTFVLFAQDVLGLGAAQYGLLTTSGAVGGVLGSLLASKVAGRLSRGTTLFVAMSVFGGTQLVIGLFPQALLAWSMMVLGMFFSMVWNVITVSLRQRIIPDELLGRVNSVYRFFGWGMMSLGAIAGGALVSATGPFVGRAWSLRIPFLVAGLFQLAMLIYAVPRFNTRRIEEAERAAGVEPA